MSKEKQQKTSILIVDDEPTNLSVLFDYLNKMGFKVFVAQSGAHALEQIEYERPDIILLDVLMPGTDGFETCALLKKHEATKDVPVIFMTALSRTEDIIHGFEVGGVDYITKPFQQEELVARIHTHLTLQRQRRELYELNSMKDRFFSIIAHDMRNALVPMIGLSDLLSDEYVNKDHVREVAKKMDEYIKNAHRLLENLLYWASLKVNKVPFQPAAIDLHNVLLEIRGLLRGQARQKQINLSDSIEPETFVYADQEMTNMILQNLITNSLKFTPSGGSVTVSARLQEAFVEISVADTGVGIAEEHLPRLFKIDQKFCTNGTNGETGSGLGLILCKELVEKNGGQISVTSKVGKGTTLTLTLPRPDLN